MTIPSDGRETGIARDDLARAPRDAAPGPRRRAFRVLALVEAENHVCARYRVRAFAPAIAEAGGTLDVRGWNETRGLARLRLLASARDYDVVWLQRKLPAPWEFALLRRSARRLVFDYDDAVMHRDSNDPRGPDCPRRASRFRRIVREADLLTAGNRFLADRAAAFADPARSTSTRPRPRPRVAVVPTAVPVPDAPPPSGSGLDDGRCVLAWIGSSSTLRGIERKAELWRALGRERPALRLRVICDRFPDFTPLAVENIPWSEAVEADALRTSDAGLSWIPDDLWSRGKCGLKVLQYQAAALPVVANPVGVHPEMIEPGVSGWLPETDDEWRDALTRLADDPETRRAMGLRGWASARARYSVRVWGPIVAGLLSGALQPEDPAARPDLSQPQPQPQPQPRPAPARAGGRS